MLSPAAPDWLGKEGIPWALVVSALLVSVPLTHLLFLSFSASFCAVPGGGTEHF